MEFQIESQPGRVSITGDMTVYGAADLKPALLAEMPQDGQPFALDLSQVGEFDTAGLQLLLMLSRTAAGGLRIVACSASVRAALELSHLNRLIVEETATREVA